MLGPCPPGRDPLGDALAAFAGAPGGPTALPWQAGLLYSTNPSPGEGSPCLEEPAFPQPQALGAALLAAQLRLLGSLLAAVSPANQVHSRRSPCLALTAVCVDDTQYYRSGSFCVAHTTSSPTLHTSASDLRSTDARRACIDYA